VTHTDPYYNSLFNIPSAPYIRDECTGCILQVQQGSTLTAVVKVLDHRGDPLPAEYFQLMKLEPSLDEKSQHLIRIQEVGNEERTSALFIVKGVELGTASLKFVAQAQRGANITSNVQNIQVCNGTNAFIG